MTKLLFCLFFFTSSVRANTEGQSVTIPAGKYRRFFKEATGRKALLKDSSSPNEEEREVELRSFLLDKFPVSNRDFNDFLTRFPEYRKSHIVRLFAETRYLEVWKGDLLTEKELTEFGDKPVTSVSWFIARKYCRSKEKRLPTIDEWEYASDSSNREVLNLLLTWYAKTGDQPLAKIGQQSPNKYGVYDMHGLTWEWVEDYNSVMISSDSRTKGDRSGGLFCGGGSVNAKDAEEYATFMRYGFRSGLQGDYCIKTLGFRCAADIKKDK